MRQLQDIIGKKFGTLTVIKCNETNINENSLFLCHCDCGYELLRKYRDIIRTMSKSCPNCRSKYRDINQTKEFEALYSVWTDMINRTTKNHKHNRSCYKNHNITVCTEWRTDFRSFYNWSIENGYKYEKLHNGINKYTIDRIDPYKGYCPENCRWITIQEQQKHKTNNKIIEWQGKEYKIWELADKYNIDRNTLYNRLFVRGWDIERSLFEKVRISRILLEYNGKPVTILDIAKLSGLAKTSVRKRLEKGWSIDKIISTPRQNKWESLRDSQK